MREFIAMPKLKGAAAGPVLSGLKMRLNFLPKNSSQKDQKAQFAWYRRFDTVVVQNECCCALAGQIR